jgi:indolepyruvate ferredoxin oxidoreductase alpha subunit
VTRFVVDTSAVLHLLAEDIVVSDDHQLVAPTLIRSQMLAELYGAVRRGDMTEDEGLDRHERFGKMKIRLLGDAVLRRNAWKIAAQMRWESTFDAEYVALTRLQADALVTMDEELARAVEGLIETARIEDLRS